MVVGENVSVSDGDEICGSRSNDASGCISSGCIPFYFGGADAESYDKRRKCGYVAIPDVVKDLICDALNAINDL